MARLSQRNLRVENTSSRAEITSIGMTRLSINVRVIIKPHCSLACHCCCFSLQIKKLQLYALKLNDVISDAALSLKLTGEEYSSVKTKHQSLLLGKHELHEMSSLQVRDEDFHFIFPELSEDMTQTVFGEATNVHVQVMCEFNYQN